MMADHQPTYIFKEGLVYQMIDGKIVSSVKESELGAQGFPIHDVVEMPSVPNDLQGDLEANPCPECGLQLERDGSCPNCGYQEYGEEPMGGSPEIPMHGQLLANQTITTPNGLKGKVLARVKGLWGDEVTVRFENGVIKKIPVDKRLTFSSSEAETDKSSIDQLKERVAATYQTDKASLLERKEELRKIIADAASLSEDSADSELEGIDQISTEAKFETKEIDSALEYLASEEIEGFEPPAPIEGIQPVLQSSMGNSRADWLDQVLGEMVAEANSRDYEKLMDEGPEAFVASLDDAQLADAATTRVMAQREIRSYTAGADEDLKGNYEKIWLARVEANRKERFASRKQEIKKEAASEEISAPDESLFL